MTINLTMPDIQELKPRITVFGVGGAGGNAVNNMIEAGLDGVEFVVANTDAQALALNKAERIVQMGVGVTEGLGAGSQPEVGHAAAEETIDEINDHLTGSHMVFITAGMGGGTGTGAAPVVARAAREQGILTVGVVTKPFQFEGQRRMKLAEAGIDELHRHVDTLIVIPNQNLFRVANEKTTFSDAFAMADEVLYSGVACITDLMVKEGLINLDFADVRSVMRGMGKAMMGTGEATGEDRARHAAEAAIANPLLDDVSMRGAKGLLISITGGRDMTLYEVDEAASRIREEVDEDANIILGATFDDALEGTIRVSVVATGTEASMIQAMSPQVKDATRAISAADIREQTAETMPETMPDAKPMAATADMAKAPMMRDEAMVKKPMPLPRAMKMEPAPALAPTAAPAPAPMATPTPAVVMNHNNVSIERTQPFAGSDADMSALDQFEEGEPVAVAPSEPVVPSAPFVPSAPVQPARRMPARDDFSPVAQREMAQEETVSEESPTRTLFQRLANRVSQQKRVEPAPTSASAPMPMADSDMMARNAVEAPMPTAKMAAPTRPPMSGRPSTEGATGSMDAQGRVMPAGESMAATTSEPQVDIPAFLRRKA